MEYYGLHACNLLFPKIAGKENILSLHTFVRFNSVQQQVTSILNSLKVLGFSRTV